MSFKLINSVCCYWIAHGNRMQKFFFLPLCYSANPVYLVVKVVFIITGEACSTNLKSLKYGIWISALGPLFNQTSGFG